MKANLSFSQQKSSLNENHLYLPCGDMVMVMIYPDVRIVCHLKYSVPFQKLAQPLSDLVTYNVS